MNMTNITQEKYRKKFMKQGSHLRYCRNVGGIWQGLAVMGGMLLAVVWVIGLLTGPIMRPQDCAIFLTAGSAVPLLMLVGSLLMQKKKVNGYIEYYSKKNYYTAEEVGMLDRELSGNDVVLFATRKNDSDIRSYYTNTPHWIKYPLLTGYIRRIVDIAAAWFDPKPFYKGVQADAHLFMLDSRGEIMVFSMTEPFAADIISDLTKKNKDMIASRFFEFDGEKYDCQEQPEKVAALYRKHVQMN